MTLDITGFARDALDSYMQMKSISVALVRRPVDAVAILHVVGTDGHHNVLAMAAEGHPTDMVVDVLQIARDEFGPISAAAVLSDALMRKPRPGDDEHNWQRGKLQAEFDSDPTSDVTEVLMVTARSVLGPTATGMVTYRYGDDGVVVFAKPVMTGGQSGAMPDALRLGFELLIAETN